MSSDHKATMDSPKRASAGNKHTHNSSYDAMGNQRMAELMADYRPCILRGDLEAYLDCPSRGAKAGGAHGQPIVSPTTLKTRHAIPEVQKQGAPTGTHFFTKNH